MKRILTLALVFALALTLALPAAAFAKKGGIPANGKSKAGESAVQTEEPADDVTAEPADKDKGKFKEKDKNKAGDDAVATDEDAVVDEETEATPPEKLTGIENALSRLQRNLARKQADYDAGLRSNLPSGLQATIAKFMSWLGIEPAPEAENDDEGSDETSGTVEPDPELDEGEIDDELDPGVEVPPAE